MDPDLLFSPINFQLLHHVAKHLLDTDIMFDTKLITEPGSDYVTHACFKTKLSHSVIPPIDQFGIFIQNPDAFERYFAVFVVAVEERNFSYSVLIRKRGFNSKPMNLPISSHSNKTKYGRPYNYFLLQEIKSLDSTIKFERIIEKFGEERNTHLQMRELLPMPVNFFTDN